MDNVHIVLVHRRLVVDGSPVEESSVSYASGLAEEELLEQKNMRLRLVYFIVLPP